MYKSFGECFDTIIEFLGRLPINNLKAINELDLVRGSYAHILLGKVNPSKYADKL